MNNKLFAEVREKLLEKGQINNGALLYIIDELTYKIDILEEKVKKLGEK